MASDVESPTPRMPNSLQWQERIQAEELNSITIDLAGALEGLLSQAAVDGADDDEINPQSVFAANAALAAFKRNPYFCPKDCSLPPEASKLNNGRLTQFLGACLNDILPLAEHEIDRLKNDHNCTKDSADFELHQEAAKKYERAKIALSHLDQTQLFIDGTPGSQFDDEFEVHFSWEYEPSEG